ncbi:hypothetical protein Tco_0339092 [Tanacetum coccineum]
MQRLKSFQIWGFRLVAMISRIVDALVGPTPVAVEADADSLAIEGNLVFALAPGPKRSASVCGIMAKVIGEAT